ncbi:MAG TPA: TlpA disulfide reductase family protein [Sphingomicrobium sp.]
MRLILLLLALLAAGGCDRQKAEVQQGNEAGALGIPTKGVDRSYAGKPAPDTPYLGSDGDEDSLTGNRGPVLVNFWATWCAPCVKELPMLDALARKHAETGDLEVIAMNQDMAPQGSIEAFYAKLGINGLGLDQDPQMKLAGALGINVLPTTILFVDGKEVWRYVGDLDWNGPEAAKLLAEAGAASR